MLLEDEEKLHILDDIIAAMDEDGMSPAEGLVGEILAQVGAEYSPNKRWYMHKHWKVFPENVGYYILDEYKAFTAQQKFDALMDQITARQSVQPYLWSDFDNLFDKTQWFNAQYIPFYFTIDEIVWGRKKVLHQQGVVAHASWIPVEGNPYSGFF